MVQQAMKGKRVGPDEGKLLFSCHFGRQRMLDTRELLLYLRGILNFFKIYTSKPLFAVLLIRP